ncbi:DUF5107 domain-containing protein [uncultured Parabacteroides sp.]|uniref:DUF5107 domain-containing protein n=1 Tax=uncultured Parabacteroides sp. TaxID=512312 RepID=UPI00259B3E5F|nr:DUF5107 domain-containing protein [uncultured Parabacteroides sp.]
MENDFIKVSIFPEIGGKIWEAVEKSTGKEFIYYNHSVKFRDIAIRGPWTSGGIEFNFGIIGHVPTSTTPVDYLTRTNEEGSRKTGNEQKADILANSWLKDNPDHKIAQWCTTIYKGDKNKATSLFSERYTIEESTPWEAVSYDRIFTIIADLFKSINEL